MTKPYTPKTIVVASALKAICHKSNMCYDSHLVNAMESKVKEMMEIAIQRAEANQRSTVMPRDI